MNGFVLSSGGHSGMTGLQMGLREFGLDPNDWHLLPGPDRDFFIFSKHDSDFVMKGDVVEKGHALHWQSLQVVGL